VLSGYRAQVAGIKLNILFNTHGTMTKRGKTQKSRKDLEKDKDSSSATAVEVTEHNVVV